MDGCQNSGDGLLLLAAAAAMGLAQGKSADEVGLLAAFFTLFFLKNHGVRCMI